MDRTPGYPSGLPPSRQSHLGWQPSRFLTDRAEAERALQLAERLGSINAAAQQLGTSWPSLRKAFIRHGLGMPARNPEAVRQRAIAAAGRYAGRPVAPALDPVFVTLNPGQLPTRRSPQAEQGVRLRRAEEIETLSHRTIVELNAESRLAPERRLAAIARRPERAQRLADERAQRQGDERAGRVDRRQLQRTARSDRSQRPAGRSRRRGIWSPMPADPTGLERPHGEARFCADLTAYLNTLLLHELGELLRELP